MKTLVIKNHRPTNACDYTDAIINFRNFDCIEKVHTHEVEGEQKYRVTLFTTHENYDLRNLSKTEADRLMQRLLAFSRYDTKGETLTITTNLDGITVEET